MIAAYGNIHDQRCLAWSEIWQRLAMTLAPWNWVPVLAL